MEKELTGVLKKARAMKRHFGFIIFIDLFFLLGVNINMLRTLGSEGLGPCRRNSIKKDLRIGEKCEGKG